MEINNDEYNLSIYDFNSTINYIKNNFIKLLLLGLVFFIIYIVDYISNINTMLMSQISMMSSITTQIQMPQIKMSKPRKISKK